MSRLHGPSQLLRRSTPSYVGTPERSRYRGKNPSDQDICSRTLNVPDGVERRAPLVHTPCSPHPEGYVTRGVPK